MDNQLKRPQSPWQQNVTLDANLLPPAKKQRLSPSAGSVTSPFNVPPHPSNANSPNLQHVSLPNAYNQQRPPMPNGFHYSASQPMQNIMGPPQRPAEKPPEKEEQPERHLDINELSDLVTSSGVDLRREEEFMASTLRRDRLNQTRSSHVTFPQTNFDLLSQTNFGALGNRSQLAHPVPQKTAEEELSEKHKAAVRAYNIRQQQHLENPFLLGQPMRLRMERVANENGIRMPMEGLFDRVPKEPQNVTGSATRGADGSAIQTLDAPSILHKNAPLDPIMSLLSLATNERIRSLMEDSYGLARGRQTTSNGVVPPEWSDVAEGLNGVTPEPAKTVPTSVTNTSWDRPPAPETNGEQTCDSSNVARVSSQNTTAFAPQDNGFVTALTSLTAADRKTEEARAKRRAGRKARKRSQAASGASTAQGGTPNGAATPAANPQPGEIAPDKPMTKKEREKAAKAEVTDEVAMRNTNAAAAMALGSRKRFSWMNPAKNAQAAGGGKPGGVGGGGRFGAVGPGGASGAANTGDAMVGKDGLPGPGADRKWGGWKEDGPGGRDVQLRDWVNVLEGDGRERRTLGYALAKLGKDVKAQDT